MWPRQLETVTLILIAVGIACAIRLPLTSWERDAVLNTAWARAPGTEVVRMRRGACVFYWMLRGKFLGRSSTARVDVLREGKSGRIDIAIAQGGDTTFLSKRGPAFEAA